MPSPPVTAFIPMAIACTSSSPGPRLHRCAILFLRRRSWPPWRKRSPLRISQPNYGSFPTPPSIKPNRSGNFFRTLRSLQIRWPPISPGTRSITPAIWSTRPHSTSWLPFAGRSARSAPCITTATRIAGWPSPSVAYRLKISVSSIKTSMPACVSWKPPIP